MKRKILAASCVPLLYLSQLIAANWLSYGSDPQRTGWSPEETDLNPETAKSITLLWKTHLDNQPRELNSLTAPVNVEWVVTNKGMAEIVIVGGASDDIFAMDADTGKLLWKKTFVIEGKPRQQLFWLCPNALNATPLIRRDGLSASVLAIASDGKLHVLNVIDGEDRVPPHQFVPPFSKNWSLNLISEGENYEHPDPGVVTQAPRRIATAPSRASTRWTYARRIIRLISSRQPTAARAFGDVRVWLSARAAWCLRRPETVPTTPAATSFRIRFCSFRQKI